MYKISYTKQAVKDIQYLKSAKLDSKACNLIKVIQSDPLKNPPPYEILTGNLSGLISRRINIQHRLVYQIFTTPTKENDVQYEGNILILRMWSHYEKIS